MMTSQSIVIMDVGDRDSSGLFRRESLPIDSNETVAQLRSQVCERFGKIAAQFQMIYLGRILDDLERLDKVGVNAGSTVLLYPKIEKIHPPPKDLAMNQERILSSIRELNQLKAIHLVSTTELQMQISRALPHVTAPTFALLHNDRMLQTWALGRPEHFEKMAENFPYLGDVLKAAVQFVAKKEKIVQPVAGCQYHVDGLSSESDEEEEVLQQAQQQVPRPWVRRGAPPQPGPSRSEATDNRPITGPMLQAALQNAYTMQSEVAIQTFAPQLQMMREMGLTNERACIQALVRTGGDVDMAINILFSE